MQLEPVIGLEVHAQLATKTKLFCACPAPSADSKPNTCVCPVCTGQPGALPALNSAAVDNAVKAGHSLNCAVSAVSVFARKNYFYPDCPKNYQISQYDRPLAENGFISISLPAGEKRVRIKRVHVEEDAGKLLHAIGSEELPFSLVDFNRCGMPLIEIVSEPDMFSPDEAYLYLTALKSVLQWCGVSNCDMEKGELRVDVNLSLKPAGQAELGTKVEVKNLNSFKAVKEALRFEIDRQAAVLADGGRIAQETRLWDDAAKTTSAMRSKEQAHDYRYFPEPDLLPLKIEQARIESIKAALPELPAARQARIIKEYGLSDYDAGVLTSAKELADIFEAAAGAAAAKAPAQPKDKLAKTIANFITNDFLAYTKDKKPASPASPQLFASLAALCSAGTVSVSGAKKLLSESLSTGKPPEELLSASDMGQINDKAQLEAWVHEAVAAQPKAVADYRAGNEKAIGALVGLVMKKSKGKANPALTNQIIKEILG